MIVRYWHPFQEVETLRRQLDSVFNEVGSAIERAPFAWTPAVRLTEDSDRYQLTVQLSGIESDAIDVQATREAIVISGERKRSDVAEGERILHDDMNYGEFRRVINLPKPIQNDAVEANFDNGLLTLTLPKVEDVRNKVVKVNLGQHDNTAEELPQADA
ncbi:Hsp20/alpha crystallin family protein [Oscillatoria sp. CS-180]|uniref:Hsp20/alpha crystallin family protein n=1 Tax=Oscillatoria sp. CS-180 TaxID=3021720 RepID=UPI00232B8217|nr:Hsp20/alpha crystallin family protein [Oscillatoria sp. CS-180]MDB9528847.1 Hsp20/alpha crystallin family protein [Oscillatoria sp. CS-180]